MKQNVGAVDKMIRGVVGLFLIYIAAANFQNGVLSGIAFVIGFLLILTSMFGFCPLYKLLGISTKHEKNPPTPPQQ
jgi:hypothetical protein